MHGTRLHEAVAYGWLHLLSALALTLSRSEASDFKGLQPVIVILPCSSGELLDSQLGELAEADSLFSDIHWEDNSNYAVGPA